MIPFAVILIAVVLIALVARAGSKVRTPAPGDDRAWLAGSDGSVPPATDEGWGVSSTGSSAASLAAEEDPLADDEGDADSEAGGTPESAEPDPEWADLVTVLRTSDPALLAVSKSLLEAEDIPSVAQGEGLQDLVGLGRVGGSNLVAGPVELQVHREDEARARLVLQDQQTELLEPLPDPGEDVS